MAKKVKSSIHMLGFIIEKFFKKNKKKRILTSFNRRMKNFSYLKEK